MLASYDKVNALRLRSALQIQLPFLTGHESYLLSRVVSALESGDKAQLAEVLAVAFRNRNVSRNIVQQISRYDFFWHQHQQFRYNRWFDGFGQLWIVGITGFPSTENSPSTFFHVFSSILRRALGQGSFLARLITNREELITDDQNVTAQNLAAESNGFETANRNQHGAYFGREKTNDFRRQHRLPVVRFGDHRVTRAPHASRAPRLNGPYSTRAHLRTKALCARSSASRSRR